MSFKDRMQQSRFELKYLLSEETALAIRDFVRSYLDLDEYSVGRPNFSYPVHSLYLDSPDLKTYWDTINGNKNRYKLRLRYYSTNPGAPIFFEIKRRMNSCIMKQRGGVKQEFVPTLLRGQFPEMEHLLTQAPKPFVAIQRFTELMTRIHAAPKVHIAYLREAYVSENDEVRVTMDREICGEPHSSLAPTTKLENPRRSFANTVVLELKFTNRFPDWFKEMVRVFHIMQCGAAKYVESIQAIGSRVLQSPIPVIEEETRISPN
jgi:SPX domain protein involved in polyphosphate accumulation